MAHTALMDSKKKNSERYRKSTRMARIRKRLADQADKAAEKLDKKFTEIVNDALREYLERHNLWPTD